MCITKDVRINATPPEATMALIQICSEYRSWTAPRAAAASRPWEKAKEPIGNPGDSQASNR